MEKEGCFLGVAPPRGHLEEGETTGMKEIPREREGSRLRGVPSSLGGTREVESASC